MIAKLLEARPHHIPDGSRVRGTKRREGIAYENYVHSILASIYGSRFYGNPWFEYSDGNARNWCSPDFILLPEDLDKGVLIVGECKLTYKGSAWEKYRTLYKPVVSTVFEGYDIRGVQVCRHLKRGVRPCNMGLGDLGNHVWGKDQDLLVINHRP